MDDGIYSQNFNVEHCILALIGSLFNSALHATLVDFQCTPRISLIHFRCRYSYGSESLTGKSIPHSSLHSSLQIRIIGLYQGAEKCFEQWTWITKFNTFLYLKGDFSSFSHQ